MTEERVEVWRSSRAPEIEARHVMASTRCWRVVNDRVCIAVSHGGLTEYRYRGKTRVKHEGVVTVHEPGDAYSALRQHGVGSATVITVDPSFLDAWRPREWVGAHFVPEPESDFGLAKKIVRLAHAVRDQRDAAFLETRLALAFGQLFARRSERSRKRALSSEHRAVRLVKERLHQTLDANVRLRDLAREVDLHELYVLQLFREAVGIPPHAYHLQIRLARARALLANGAPVADVALKLGFSDQSHLSRHFRRTFGIAPGVYAKSGQ